MANRQLCRVCVPRLLPVSRSSTLSALSSSSRSPVSNRQSMREARLRAAREQHSSPPNYTLAELVFNPDLQRNVHDIGVIETKKCDKDCNAAFEHDGYSKEAVEQLNHLLISDETNKAVNEAFEAAIAQLNFLQSNEDTIRDSVISRRDARKFTVKYLERSGLALETVEKLSYIHVAGTKGKGSTCALTESLLRHQGLKTGFYSSPHILATNERIRINGQPLDKAKFTEHFWKVYNRLWELREHDHDMPAYFKFVTILGFHVFVEEKVDVAVLEVGIGGESDCTNIVRNVGTVGITSLALEHTDLLGITLEEIAWQKAGIIKPGSHVFTHVTQPECLEVIRQRAKDNGIDTIFQVPPTEEYFKSEATAAQPYEDLSAVIKLNGSLAVQLAMDYLVRAKGREHNANEIMMDQQLLDGLVKSHWPGRCQKVEWRGMRLFFDGAHTLESIEVCAEWFHKNVKDSPNPKILIFNRKGQTDIRPLLKVLHRTYPFDMACFSPNLSASKPIYASQVFLSVSEERQLGRSQSIANDWNDLCRAENTPLNSQAFPHLVDTFIAIREKYPLTDTSGELDVLVTGSFHLVGAAIAALDSIDQSQRNEQDDPK
ncbi:putative folylpolyglutamate synthase isoform X3 [Drosophila kikkawai]|nr:folylpolyglutamate synthase, mitochondrial isoform X3 [Drosophila kikkawai]XP_017034891.1 folylpolyglutamate synthase, mitochondrial isoform X3 [Drosophila kikkawai]